MDGALSRRGLLGGAAVVAAGVAGTVAGCSPKRRQERGVAGAPPFDSQSWDSVRAQFALRTGVAHLATFVFATHPAQVRAAIEEHRAGLDADPAGYLAEHEARLDEAAAALAAAYLETSRTQVALTDSTTMGLGLLYTGLRLDPGDDVLTTEHDFYATHESLRLRAVRDGVTVRRVRLYRDPATASVDEIVSSLLAQLRPQTRIVAVTWVHSSTGVKLPIRAMADALRARSPQALLCVDGVHGFAAEDATPARLGCDFLVSGCHKWLYGPRGTGLVWGSPAGWARFTPVIPAFERASFGNWMGFAAGPVPPGPGATPGGYHSFEHRWALAEAFTFHNRLGRARVAARTRELASALKDGLAGVPGVRLATPVTPELSAGIVCCSVEGVAVGEAVDRLQAAKVVASATPYNPSLLRFGTSILNSERDVTAAVAAVRSLT
ncbi:MAG TPA: aminotransferase class V-fold PLP-dependent enzyme [Pilimelia sp.]|nr:aminotransferase class V-fold PLP-dependent enzyme [Pilimelia sp.]